MIDYGKALPAVKRETYDEAMLSTSSQLAQKLTQVMQEQRLSGSAIAAHCNVSKQAVYGWKMTGRMDKKYLPALAELTGKPLEWWLESGSLQSDASARKALEWIPQEPTPPPVAMQPNQPEDASVTPICTWPFKEISYRRFMALPREAQREIDEYLDSMVLRWERKLAKSEDSRKQC